jgi:alginate O-acetyltransferase complex protein AlgI
MAVGLGYLLGFEFPQNFNSPYKAINISDFWRRWHMTLSGWLRDYLFIPLGGSRYGRLLTLRNLLIVMFLGGLWHGAGWTFVVWGLYHGVLLAIYSLLRHRLTLPLPHVLCAACTFVCVVVGWVVFRATDMQMALHLLGSMAGAHGFEWEALHAVGGSKALALLTALLTIVFMAPNTYEIKLRPNLWLGFAVGIALAISVLRFGKESPFLYFQF